MGNSTINTISVGETVRFAYRFTFSQLGTIIGLIWLPMVGIAILEFLPYALDGIGPAANQDPNAMGAALLRNIVFWLLSVLLYAVVNVAVVQQALGLRSGNAIVHFALGRTEFRMWGASLLYIAIMIALCAGLIIAVMATGMVGQAVGSKPIGAIAAAVVLFAGTCVVFVSLARLGFLLVPATVTEQKVSFERNWLLTAGNFWRITAILFFVTLPTVVILMTATFAVMGKEFDALGQIASRISFEALMERYRMIVSAHASTMIGINLILAPFTFGLTMGAAAAGYKAVTASPKVDVAA
jgi:hypothetical protein